MIRISVELVVGRGRASRTLAIGELTNISGKAVSDYRISLGAEQTRRGTRIDDGYVGVLQAYPRWSGPLWDLVGRGICTALAGEETLPERPAPVEELVPILTTPDGGLKYVRFRDIPEPTRTHFSLSMAGSTCPIIPGEGECAYAWDWVDFLAGNRNP